MPFNFLFLLENDLWLNRNIAMFMFVSTLVFIFIIRHHNYNWRFTVRFYCVSDWHVSCLRFLMNRKIILLYRQIILLLLWNINQPPVLLADATPREPSISYDVNQSFKMVRINNWFLKTLIFLSVPCLLGFKSIMSTLAGNAQKFI